MDIHENFYNVALRKKVLPGSAEPPLPGIPPFMPVQPVLSGTVPVGSITPFAGKISDLPADEPEEYVTGVEAFGWMHCDGRELQAANYPELFHALGYLYGGSGDTFKIPDYRGYFLRGVDGGSGKDPDVSERKTPVGGTGDSTGVGSIQEDALQKHEHTYDKVNVSGVSAPGSAAGVAATPTLTGREAGDGPTDSLSAPGNVKVSEKETRAVNVYVHFLIKFTYGLYER